MKTRFIDRFTDWLYDVDYWFSSIKRLFVKPYEYPPEIMNKAKILADRPYMIGVVSETLTNGKRIYVAYHPELNGCMTQADDPETAIKDLHELRPEFICHYIQYNIPVPEPNILDFNGTHNVVALTFNASDIYWLDRMKQMTVTEGGNIRKW